MSVTSDRPPPRAEVRVADRSEVAASLVLTRYTHQPLPSKGGGSCHSWASIRAGKDAPESRRTQGPHSPRIAPDNVAPAGNRHAGVKVESRCRKNSDGRYLPELCPKAGTQRCPTAVEGRARPERKATKDAD